MVFRLFQTLPSHRMPYSFVRAVLFVMIMGATAAQAQIGGIDPDPGDPGTGGRNTIQGTIYLPSGKRLDRRVRVNLQNINRDFSTMSDDNGAFSFRRLAGGSYRVTVEAGKEYAPATENVDIYEAGGRRNPLGQMITIQIQLQFKQASGNKLPALVDASLAGVPKPALEHYRKALESERAGNAKKAIEQLKAALSLKPEFMLALNELGLLYMRLGELDKASDALLSALKLAPDASAPRLNYGLLLVRKKQFAEAAAELQRALEKDDTSVIAHVNLGRALIGVGNDKEAEQHLLRAISLGGNDSILAHKYLGAIYKERGENAKAAAELEKYLSLAPNDKDSGQIRQIIKDLRAQTTASQK